MKQVLKCAALIAAIVLGCAAGFFNARISSALGVADFASLLLVPARRYLFILQILAIPLIVSSLSAGLGKLIRKKRGHFFAGRIIVVFGLCVLAVILAGTIIGVIEKPGSSLEHVSDLSKFVLETERTRIPELSLSDQAVYEPAVPVVFSKPLIMILFFSVLLGAVLGFLEEKSAEPLNSLLASVFQASKKLAAWLLRLLPPALVCLAAGQFALLDIQRFTAMAKFIRLYIAGTGVLFAAVMVILWIRSGIINPFRVCSILIEAPLLALASHSPLTVLPCAVNSLVRMTKLNGDSLHISLSLGLSLARFGSIFYFCLASFFIVQFYGVHVNGARYFIIVCGSILAGSATAALPAAAALPMISLVLNPLNLPVETALLIFAAVDPLIAPFRNFMTVYVNLAAAAIAAKREREQSKEPAREEPKKPFLIYVQGNEKPPILVRKKRKLDGLEVKVLEEIARRLGRKAVFKDSVRMGYEEELLVKREADIVAGVIKKSREVPPGYAATRVWATITEKGRKTQVCFFLPEASLDAERIDKIIKNLAEENFLAKPG